MSAIRPPLRDHAPYSIDAAGTQRLWRGIAARLDRRQTSGTSRRFALWFACGAMAGVAFMLAVDHRPVRTAMEASPMTGPLALSDGSPLRLLEVRPGAASSAAALSDGSVLSLDAGARLEPLENTARSVLLLLTEGRVTFDVRPGGPRRWSIECGLATIEVVGTRFTITRSVDRVLVEVERGTVLVRGERVPDRVQRLTAGAKLEIAADLPSAAPPPPATAAPGPSASVSAAAAPSRVWRDLATRGAYADAYQALGANGIGREVTRSVTAEDLMVLADVARLSGHAAEAVGPLTRVVSEHIDDSRAPLAAFTLGKIHLGTLAQPAAAARDFSQALALGLPSGLLEDAYAYLVEARAKAGDPDGARAAYESYLQHFPKSARSESVSRWITPR
jgi:transmembrane sensor